MAQQVRIFALDDYQLSSAALRRLGEQSVRFSVQLRGLKMPSLLPLRPKQRDVKLRAALKQQFKQLAQHFPEALLKSRDERRGSWTLDGTLPARKMWAFASRPEVQGLTIHSIDGRRRIARRHTLGWFSVWGVVAIQIEGRTQGKVDVEDRFVLVKAYDAKDARRRLRQEWSNYARPSNITLQPSNRASGYSDFQQLSRAQGTSSTCVSFLTMPTLNWASNTYPPLQPPAEKRGG